MHGVWTSGKMSATEVEALVILSQGRDFVLLIKIKY